MEQFKFAIGPYELFASVIGGLPLALAIDLAYDPTISAQNILTLVQGNFSTQIALVFLFFSYLLGGLVQSLTWKYFMALCKIFKQNHHDYYGMMIASRTQSAEDLKLLAADAAAGLKALNFEDNLALLLHKKVGYAANIDWINSRVKAYLREHNSPSAITAESYHASHVMYRNISFGLLFLGMTILTNLFRVGSFSLGSFLLILISIGLSYLAFFRSLSFKQWQEKALLLGFYFAACDD
jgi:hypothetical protein